MSCKIVVIGDLHVKKNNLSVIRIFQEKLYEYCQNVAPTHIIFLGDLLDNHNTVYISCLNLMHDIINMCREFCPVYLIVGNHDRSFQNEFLTNNHWMNAFKEWDRVVVADKVVVVNEPQFNLKFVLVPYVENGRFIEALNTTRDDGWKNADFIFAHQEFKNVKMGAFLSVDGDEWSLEYPQVISGHIHTIQKVQNNIFYTGSALQHAYSDNSKKIVLCIERNEDEDDENNTFKMIETELNVPKKKLIHVAGKDGFENLKLENVLTGNNYEITIAVNCSVEVFKHLQKSTLYKQFTQKNNIKIIIDKKKNVENLKNVIAHIKHNENNENMDINKIWYKLLLQEKDTNNFRSLLIEDYKKIV